MENQTAHKRFRVEDLREFLRLKRNDSARRGDVDGARDADRADILLSDFLAEWPEGEVL